MVSGVKYYGYRITILMDEKQVIAECLKGQTESFRQIVEAYADQMMALALSLLGNRQDAEDVCQEAFVQAFRNLHRYNPARSFRNWLLTILYRRSLDLKRKRTRWRRLLHHLSGYLLEAPSLSISRNMSRNNSEETEITGLSLPFPDNLTLPERAALTLWAGDGLNSQEIATILGCRPSTVRVHLYLARRKIRTWLDEKKERREK
jgi:RNA polymerase sigma-70 factor (ECF subfamily)